jgi:hypothetical protein
LDLGAVPSFIDLGAVQTPQAGGVTGTSATTNANDTSAASGTTTVVGTSAASNANDASSASGTTTVVGSSATTNANDTSAASGTPTIQGSSATTNADDTSSASGSPILVGSSATTNANDTSAASGTTTVTGASATTNADDASAASGTTTVTGTSGTTNADDTCDAEGDVGGAVTGTSATTNANDTSTASGVVPVVGASATTNANDTCTASGVVAAPVSGSAACVNQNDTSDAEGETPGPAESLEPLKMPYFAQVLDNTGRLAEVWKNYFLAWARQIQAGTVNWIRGAPNRILVSGPNTEPTIDISPNYVGQESITTLGTVEVGTWEATPIAADHGGTGQTAYLLGDTLYASGPAALSKLPGIVATSRHLLSQTGAGAVSAAPSWTSPVVAEAGIPGRLIRGTTAGDIAAVGGQIILVDGDDLAAVVAALGSTPAQIVVCGQMEIAANLEIPDTIAISAPKCALPNFDIATGVTLTIQGSFEAGNYTVFTGLGSVVFARGNLLLANIMWWGAIPLFGINSTAAIQAAVDAVYASGGGEVFFPYGTYYVTSITRNWDAATSMRFIGAGMHATKLEKYDTSTTPIFNFSADINVLSTYSSLENMWIWGSDSLYNCPGVRLTQVANFVMRNVEINYCSIGLDLLGALICEFQNVKTHLNVTGIKARKSDIGTVYANSNNFRGCVLTGNRFQGVDYGQGSGVRFFGGDMESNGTVPTTFTVDTATNLITLADGVLLQSGVAVRAAAATTLPTATMPTSVFTADSTTDKLTLSTALDLPTGYPFQASSTGTLPAEILVATTYYLIRETPTLYKVASSRDNALVGTALDLTTNGSGTMTLAPEGLVADNDIWWSRVSSTTGYLCSNYANAIAGTAIDLTSTGTGTLTLSFVGTGGILLRASMDDETAGGGPPDTRDPGIALANFSGVWFEANNGRAFATEKSRGLNVSLSDCLFLNSQQANGGRSIYSDGCRRIALRNVSCGGGGDNVELGYYCDTTDGVDTVLYNFSDFSPYPTHYNVTDSAGVAFPGFSSHTHWWKNKLVYFHVGVTDLAHSIGNGGTNRLTFTAGNSLGHLFAGGPVEMQSLDATDIDLTDRLDIISPSAGGPTIALESTDVDQRYIIACGGSAGGAFTPGAFGIRDATAGAKRFDILSDGKAQIFDLAGTDSRLVQADSTGLLSATVDVLSLRRAYWTKTANTGVNNSTTETTLLDTGVGSKTLSAAFFTVGKTLFFEVMGFYSTLLTPTLQLRFKLGSTTVLDSGAVVMPAGVTDQGFRIRGQMTCRTTGATGTIQAQGEVLIAGLSIPLAPLVNTGTTTIDTTGTLAVDVTAEWGTADAANTITGSNGQIEAEG